MSNLIIDPQVEEQSRPLTHAGQVWRERLNADQLPLARQMAALLNSVSTANAFYEAGAWLDGREGVPQLYPWRMSSAEIQVQGPGYWGYDSEGQPRFGVPTLEDLSRARAYLTADGRIIETATGDPNTLPEDIELSPQTVWFIPKPEEYRPVTLISPGQTLVEGTGFLCAGNWIMLYQNPLDLWPDLLVVSTAIRTARSWKSTTLRANHLHTSGKELALYRRNSQNLKQFERALCELAGLRILEQDGLIVRQETGNNVVVHWLEDGRCFTLPVTSPYEPGSIVPAGSGHILRLRHQQLQGDMWWQGRPWGAAGIPIFVFRPGFYGFSIRDELVSAYAHAEYAPTAPLTFEGDLITYSGEGIVYGTGPAVLRGRLALMQDEDAEAAYWAWQAAQERRLGTQTFARDILGLTDEDPLNTVNALGVFASIYGPWLAVVETSLDAVHPVAFREIMDYISRERPSGMQVFLAGSGQSFSAPEFYSVYLNTGELVQIDPEVLLALPLAY